MIRSLSFKTCLAQHGIDGALLFIIDFSEDVFFAVALLLVGDERTGDPESLQAGAALQSEI